MSGTGSSLPGLNDTLLPGLWHPHERRRGDFDAASQIAQLLGVNSIHNLSTSERETLTRRYGAQLGELQSLTRETNPEMFWESVLQIGNRLQQNDRLEAAMPVLQAVRSHASSEAVRSRAGSAIDAIRGVGGSGARAEFLLRRLSHEATDPAMLVGMTAASTAFRLTRVAALSRLAATPNAGIVTRLLGRSATASLVAFGAEATIFPAATRLANFGLGRQQDWSAGAMGRELAGSFFVLGGMKLAGLAGNTAFQRVHGVAPGGAATRFAGLSPITERLVPQLAMLGGIYLGHEMEMATGLRERLPGATHFVDSLAMLVQFNVAGRFSHGVLGEGFHAWERSLDAQAATLASTGPRAGNPFTGIREWFGSLGEGFGPRPALSVIGNGPRLPMLGGDRGAPAGNGIMMMANGDGSIPTGSSSVAPPRTPTVRPFSGEFPFAAGGVVMRPAKSTPVHSEIVSTEAIAAADQARLQDALSRLLGEQPAESALKGPVAELLRRETDIRNLFANPNASSWVRLDTAGQIHSAVIYEEGTPRHVFFPVRAQLQHHQGELDLAYHLVVPDNLKTAPGGGLYSWDGERITPRRRGNLMDVRSLGGDRYRLLPSSPAEIEVINLPFSRQRGLTVRDRSGALLVSVLPERILENPARRLLAMFEHQSQAENEELKGQIEAQIEELIAQLSELPVEHPARVQLIDELGSRPNSLIARLLRLMDQDRPAAERALLGEIMANREIVGAARRHRILSYDVLDPIRAGSNDPAPSGVRFLEAGEDGSMHQRLMIRSRAANSFNYLATLEEAISQLRRLQELHPDNRDNVIQVVVHRPLTLSSEEGYREFLRGSLFEALGESFDDLHLKRVTFVVSRENGYPNYVTFRRAENGQRVRDGAFVEDTRYRDIHPMLGHIIELERLDSFELERDLTHSDRFNHLYFIANRKTSELKAGSDRRLYAAGVIPETRLERDAGGTLSSAPEIEAGFVSLASAMQRSLEGRKNRPTWNRMFLQIQPVLPVSDAEASALAESLAIRHRDLLRGLGLEKVVVKARLADPRVPDGNNFRTVLIRISNPTGFRFEPQIHNVVRASVRHADGRIATREVLIRNGTYDRWLQNPEAVIPFQEWAPADIPIRPSSPVEIREQRARARGAVFAYRIPELIAAEAEQFRVDLGLAKPRILGSEPPPPSERTYPSSFIEMDLDPATTRIDEATGRLDYNVGELIPALEADGKSTRPFGGNQAGVVIGLHTDQLGTGTPVHRVVIFGDLTHEASKGALGAEECARINAAIRFAASRSIPVDWYAASNGASIKRGGVENLDATASTVREIRTLARSLGVPINVVVDDTNIGAQSYWNALAAILHDTGGILIMTPRGAMALTGPDALTAAMLRTTHSEDLPEKGKNYFPAGVRSLAGYREVHGPNGEAMLLADNMQEATRALLRHHYFTQRARGAFLVGNRVPGSEDWLDRDITESEPVAKAIRAILAGSAGDRTAILEGLRDRGSPAPLRFWPDAVGVRGQPMASGLQPQTFSSLIQEMQIGGRPVMAIFPPVGPLTPADSEIIARAIWKANERLPVLIIGSLTGFNADPLSMQNRQLFGGAAIADAIVQRRGPTLLVDMGYVVGGSFVVVSKQLSPDLRFLAIEGAHAQVIGGPSAAKVVFRGDIRNEVDALPEVIAAREAMEQARDPDTRGSLALRYDTLRRERISVAEEAQAARFDAEHSVERARRMGAVDEVVAPARLRERIIHHLEAAIQNYLARREAEEERADRESIDPSLAHPPIDALRVIRESLIRQYGESRAREIAGQLGEGLLRFANGTPDDSSGSGGTPAGDTDP